MLVIRGELLKRYPNAVIYAHRAVWRDTTKDGAPVLDINSENNRSRQGARSQAVERE